MDIWVKSDFPYFDQLIFGRMSFPETRWYVVTVWDQQMYMTRMKFGNHRPDV